MALIKRSPCEDSVDRFNHTWLVIFLLILTAVMFFIPFGLPQAGRPAERTEAPAKYSAKCWCPNQFTNSHIDYTNAACAAAYARTRSTSSPIENDSDPILATVSQIASLDNEQPLEHNSIETLTVEYTSVYYFILEYTPLLMFVSAAVFKFMHVMFLLFVSWYGVNLCSLSETWRSLITDAERRDQPKKEFLQDLTKKLESSRLLSLGYLFYKLTICTMCVIVAMVIYNSMLPGLNLLDGNHHSSDHHDVAQPRSATVNLMCKLTLLLLGSKHEHNIQCMFTATVQPDDHSQMVQFYKPFYTALLFTFITIALVDVINWTLWAVKLCRSSSLSMDAHLLVCIVAEQGDFTAADKLEEGLIHVQKGSDPNDDLNKETEDL